MITSHQNWWSLQGNMGSSNKAQKNTSKRWKFFPSIHIPLHVILSFPVHLLICEVGFSLVKTVKTDWRSKLGDDVLTNQLHIILHLSEIADCDPSPAICCCVGLDHMCVDLVLCPKKLKNHEALKSIQF